MDFRLKYYGNDRNTDCGNDGGKCHIRGTYTAACRDCGGADKIPEPGARKNDKHNRKKRRQKRGAGKQAVSKARVAGAQKPDRSPLYARHFIPALLLFFHRVWMCFAKTLQFHRGFFDGADAGIGIERHSPALCVR